MNEHNLLRWLMALGVFSAAHTALADCSSPIGKSHTSQGGGLGDHVQTKPQGGAERKS